LALVAFRALMQLFAAANQQMMLRSLVHFEASIYSMKDI
jgi:hypothetical protein